MKVMITGVDQEIARIKKLHAKETSDKLALRVQLIKSDIINATPVDTGRAREGWETMPSKNGFKLTNSVPYIESLNNGHSQQAPSRFIERTLMQHGKPVGSIVTKS